MKNVAYEYEKDGDKIIQTIVYPPVPEKKVKHEVSIPALLKEKESIVSLIASYQRRLNIIESMLANVDIENITK